MDEPITSQIVDTMQMKAEVSDDKSKMFILYCPYSACRKEFKERGNLMTHLRIHTGERPYSCTYEGCLKSFITYGNLKSHIDQHEGMKSMICPYEGCGKSYCQKNRLKAHIIIHKGGKPYQCNQPGCNKTFYEKGNLNTHLRSHLGIKQYKCYFPGCQSKYSLSISLKKHLKIHDHSKENFFCIHCANSFTRYSTLLVHLKGHETSHVSLLRTKRKLFSCSITKHDINTADINKISENFNLKEPIAKPNCNNEFRKETTSSATTEGSKNVHKLSFLSINIFKKEEGQSEDHQTDYYNLEHNLKSILSFLQNLTPNEDLKDFL